MAVNCNHRVRLPTVFARPRIDFDRVTYLRSAISNRASQTGDFLPYKQRKTKTDKRKGIQLQFHYDRCIYIFQGSL